MSALRTILEIFQVNRRNWKAVALCFLTATIFWVFNALNKDYSTSINFPLQLDYDQEKFIAVKPLPSQVRINVTGIGWDLFRRSVGLKVPPLVIPLENPAEVKKIVAAPALFAQQLERFEVNFVLTDTLRIAIESIEKRWITLRLDANALDMREDHIRTSEPRLTPDSILVTGPASVVRGFIEPVYLKLSETGIDEDYREDVEVQLINNDLVTRNPPTVQVSFDVDRLVEIRDSIPLRVVNYPKGANPYLGIKALPTRFSIPEKMMNDYHPDSVVAVIDLKNFQGGTRQIKPEVRGLPPFSEVHHIDSIFVKF